MNLSLFKAFTSAQRIEAFWEKVEKTTNCWLWKATKHRQGYGFFWDGSAMVMAHRYAYELECGVIPFGLDLDHLCRVKSCVRPAHLEPVTHRTNINRGLVCRVRLHCPHGHPYTTKNNLILSSGYRTCRTCRDLRNVLRRKPSTYELTHAYEFLNNHGGKS